MNVADALRFAAGVLREAGVPDDLTAGSLLLGHVLGVGRVALIAHPERALSDTEEAAFRAAVARRAAGEPFQYIAGVQEFYGLDFEVTPDVLIPRPETEAIVEIASRLACERPARILDIGTGSGCIAVTLATRLPNARVIATDVSGAALEVARRNAARHRVAVAFVRCDLASAVAGPFEIIVSNPPYVPERDRPTLQREVVDHEPHLALFAGEDGLAVYRKLFEDAPRLLAPSGRLVVEIGFGQSDALVELAHEKCLRVDELVDDLAGIPRMMVLR